MENRVWQRQPSHQPPIFQEISPTFLDDFLHLTPLPLWALIGEPQTTFWLWWSTRLIPLVEANILRLPQPLSWLWWPPVMLSLPNGVFPLSNHFHANCRPDTVVHHLKHIPYSMVNQLSLRCHRNRNFLPFQSSKFEWTIQYLRMIGIFRHDHEIKWGLRQKWHLLWKLCHL